MIQNVHGFIYRNCITPDFPVNGVNFVDIFPLLEQTSKDELREFFESSTITFMPEARGFLFYNYLPPTKTIPIRKQGKLPGELISYPSAKEYGFDNLFFQKDSLLRKIPKFWNPKVPVPVMFVDDVAATGQSAESFIQFMNNVSIEGYRFKVESCKFFLELCYLKARQRILNYCDFRSFYEF